MIGEVFLSGLCASIGSTLGKLAGTEAVVGNSYVIWIGLLLAMVLVNTWGCRYYLRSLDAASNTVIPTVISSAVNYIISGVIGMSLFGEAVSLRWWAGASLITIGLAMVATPEKKRTE
ncbi:hypothetical protein JYU34_021050 [Plutella xylostella]|uniref:Uncharacterized protein n=1 Tax=Plutella xylostella TaxID=51655 RepID=A0ABQ7PSL9_PLUXY|nr:hypothetical protein JYU34_021050 [Plutella xylostella]